MRTSALTLLLGGFTLCTATSVRTPSPFEGPTSAKVPDTFILIHDDECSDSRSLVQAIESLELQNNGPVLQALITEGALAHAALRIQQESTSTTTTPTTTTIAASAAAAFNASSPTPLKDLDAKHRRDLLISAFQLAVQRKSAKAEFTLSADVASLVEHHLPNLNMDIVRNTALPNDGVYKLAKAIPCLRHPPEKNAPRYIASDPIRHPDDLREDWQGIFDQWHFVGSSEYERAGTNALEAWQCFTGQGSKGEVVAVVDTGCSMHPDLERNICKPDEECAGYDYGDHDNNPFDEPLTMVHGTRVAGAVAAVTNNKNGLAGMCWGCRLSCLKVYNSEFKVLDTGAIVRSLEHILQKKIRVSNHSYTAFNWSPAEYEGHLRLQKAGHIAVVAAGNFACNIDKPYSLDFDACKSKYGEALPPSTPAAFNLDTMIVVGAVDRNNDRAWFSNFGPQTVHLMAPGKDLLLLDNTLKQKSGVSVDSGTSFSSPLVAGVVGLIWSRNPTLSAKDVRKLILDNVDRDPKFRDLCQTGGKLNVRKIMNAMGGNCSSLPENFKTLEQPTMDATARYYNREELSRGSGSASLSTLLASTIVFCLYLFFE